MTELQVVLDFACHSCGQPVEAVVRCTGKRLSLMQSVVARVTVACPHCQAANQVAFETKGRIRAVTPPTAPQWAEHSSLN